MIANNEYYKAVRYLGIGADMDSKQLRKNASSTYDLIKPASRHCDVENKISCLLSRSALGTPNSAQALLVAPGESLVAPLGATGPRLRNAAIGYLLSACAACIDGYKISPRQD